MKIGVISDTHGLFREELYDILNYVDRIIHLGDIGSEEIMEKLNKIAPTDFILGNIDDNISDVPKIKVINLDDIKVHMIHNIKELDERKLEGDTRIIAYGHSHKPNLEEKEGIIYLNPGSLGRRRFKLPITYGIIIIDENISIKIYDFFNGDILYDETYSSL